MNKQDSLLETTSPNRSLAMPWWRRLLQPPASLTNLTDQRRAQLLFGLSCIFFFTTVFGAMFAVTKYIFVVLVLVSFAGIWLSRTRFYQLGVVLIITTLTILTFVRSLDSPDSPVYLAPFTFLLASFLLPFRWSVVAILLNIVTVFLASLMGEITYEPLAQVAGTVTVVGLLFIFTTAFRNGLERDRLKELREANQALKALQTNLNDQVQARTAELSVATEVGRNLSQVSELNILLNQASELIRDRFQLYHVQIYLANLQTQTLSLRAGSGEIGKILLQKGHTLLIGTNSINGNAALSKKSIFVPDTTQSTLFKPNSWLPETRSEIAVPLLIGDRLLGVLDIQADQIGTLTESRLPIFEIVASQLAIAIDNANLFAEVNEAKANLEAYLGQLTREGWENYFDAIHNGEQLAAVYDVRTEAQEQGQVLLNEAPVAKPVDVPLVIADEPIGLISVEAGEEQYSRHEMQLIIDKVAIQVGQQLENLRLLSEAQQYRQEAETAVKRLIRDGWNIYQGQTGFSGYAYDGSQVLPLSADEADHAEQLVSLPLQVRGESIGQLQFVNADNEPVDEATMHLLEVVAQQLGNHIDNLRLAQQTEQALTQTEQLYKIGNAFNQANNMQEILETAVAPIKQSGIHEATLMFVELNAKGQPEALELLANWRPDGGGSFPVGTRFALHEFPFSGLFMNNPNEPQFIEDIATDLRVDAFTRTVMQQVGIGSLVVVPLTIAGQWVSILTFSWSTPYTFNYQLKEFFKALINLTAPVVQSQRLFSKTKAQADKERLINLISQRIQGTMSVESALQTAVTELGNTLKAQTAIVKLTKQKEGQMAQIAPEHYGEATS